VRWRQGRRPRRAHAHSPNETDRNSGIKREGRTSARRAAHRGNALRAVEVMHVDVEDRDALVTEPQGACGNCRVLRENRSRGHVGIGVMAGGRTQRELYISPSSTVAPPSPRHRGRAAPVQCPAIDTPYQPWPAEIADDAGRIGRGRPHRMDVAIISGPRIAKRRPFVPGFRQKARYSACAPFARGPLQNAVGSMMSCDRPQDPEQPVGPLGLFGGAPDDAATEERGSGARCRSV